MDDTESNVEVIMRHRLNLITTRIKELSIEAQNYRDGSEIQKAQVCASKLESLIKRFTSELNEYFRVVNNPQADQISEMSETQLNGEEVLIELKCCLEKNTSKSEPIQERQTYTAKLPTLTLPEFDGDILKWCEYYDIFKSNIHHRPIADVDKLLYLKSTLKGEPRKIIDGLETTNKNYTIAVQILEERYGKPAQIIDAHYSALSKVKTSDGSINKSRLVLNEIERHLRVLQSLGEDTTHNHLRHLITEKFPEDIIYEVKMKMTEDTVREMRKQLEIIISAKEETNRLRVEKDNIGKDGLIADLMHTIDRKKPRYGQGSKDNNFTFRNKKKDNTKRQDSKKQNFPNQSQSCSGASLGHNRKRSYDKIKEDSRERKNRSNDIKRRKLSCTYCKKDHYSDQCKEFKTIEERKFKLKKRCYCCLIEGHLSRDCKKRRKCVYCYSMNHHRSLCPEKFKAKEETTMTTLDNGTITVLQTAIVTLGNGKDKQNSMKCRVLLDSGSQRSYITKQVSRKLNLPVLEENTLSIFSFASDTPQNYESNRVKAEIVTKTNKTITLHVNEIPKISKGVTPPNIYIEKWQDRILADDGSLGERIDILIGNDYYFDLISTEKLKLNDNLYLVESEFGHIVSGKISTKEEDHNTLSVITYCQDHNPKCIYYTEPDLPLKNADITFLWSLESIGITDNPKTTREEEAIKHLNETIKYENGRYAVKWPWVQYPPDLPTNFGLAYGRLKGLLQRLQEDTLKEYEVILNEQLMNGIIEKVAPEGNVYNQRVPPIHYLAHHIVKQEGKRGRIVYDASGKLKEGKSLNENMYKGPSMIGDLVALLIQFRTHKVAVTADVEKAFLQIELQTEDRDVTRFLWIKNANEPLSMDNIIHMRFCRVPFGIIASPFILTATLKYHVSQTAPELLHKIVDKCYVDNFVTGTDSTNEAIKLYAATQKIFHSISMNMRDWTSNDKYFLSSIPAEHRSKNQKETKLLGLTWNIETDTLKLRIKNELFDEKLNKEPQTKRKILSTIASVYDPCGFSTPLTLPIKLLLQELWDRKIKWDTNIPEELQEKWGKLMEQLKDIREIEVPRFMGVTGRTEHTIYELHGFSDASKQAYGAVVYLRAENKNGRNIGFIMAKSKVVPREEREKLRMPRLELLGCYLCSKLITYIKNNIEIPISKEFIWTDSQIVLCWIKSNKLLPPFISRRINIIKENKHLEPRYINSDNNPADLATRPDMWDKKKTLWFEGPKFLKRKNKDWPNQSNMEETQPPLEEGPSDLTECFHRESKGEKTTIAINLDVPESQSSSENNYIDLSNLQREYFPEESEGKRTALAINLDVFKDVDGLLRCNGRMKNTDWPFDKRHPILLPRDCKFTEDLVMKIHQDNYHMGANHTLSKVREVYWIPRGKSYVQRVLKRCARCMKHNGGPYKLPPAPALPPERVNYTAPFTYTGVDYLGPILVNNRNGIVKRWVCLFTCLAVRAVHLEVVQDLTAEEGLLALRRMVSTRGAPHLITSDNALHFKLLAEILSNKYCIDKKIGWRFITPLAPWAGGFYERLIGIVKNCIKKTIDKHKLTDNLLATVIKEIEAVINSRPLTTVDSEMDYILKPSDFLTAGRVITLEKSDKNTGLPNTSTTKTDLIKSWNRALRILEEFKQMFYNRYLLSLRERYSHLPKEPRITSKLNPKPGQVVQIKGESKDRNDWKIGKIVSLIPSSDRQYRAAKVRVGEREYVRSISHLYPLEIDETSDTVNANEKEASLPRVRTYDTDEARCVDNTQQVMLDPLLNYEMATENSEPVDPKTQMIEGGEPVDSIKSQITEGGEPIDSMKTQMTDVCEPINQKTISDEEITPTTEIESLPHADEAHENYTNQRLRRKAATKALHKIREWTRDLNTLLLLSGNPPPGSVAETARF